MADERRGGAAGLPVRLGDASRCMHGDAERVRRLDYLVRRPPHGVSVRGAVDSLARIPTLIENVQAQRNLRMSAVSEPRDGWAHPGVIGGQRERVVGAAAEADFDAALADVDGGGGPHDLVEEGAITANLILELTFPPRGSHTRCGGTIANELGLGSAGVVSARQGGGASGRDRSAEGTAEGRVGGQVAAQHKS